MAGPLVSGLISIAEAVRAGLAEGRPVVALETSVLSHGLPQPTNLEAAHAMESAIRSVGAEPAWVWVGGGALRVGLDSERGELERLAVSGAAKVARRDLPMAVAGTRLGATTVSATLWAAHGAGIQVMATGGIGGVHPGSRDVSADLLEMARTPGVVVCSGPKSIVDPTATLERLEELGVGVLGYRCQRVPSFLVADSGLPLEHSAYTPQEVAAVAGARDRLGLQSALLVCVRPPAARAMAAEEVARAVEECERRAAAGRIRGKALTPYLLRCLSEVTGGRSLEVNLALLESNARVAAEVATRLAKSQIPSS